MQLIEVTERSDLVEPALQDTEAACRGLASDREAVLQESHSGGGFNLPSNPIQWIAPAVQQVVHVDHSELSDARSLLRAASIARKSLSTKQDLLLAAGLGL